jgi:hypothetical protein
VHVPHTPHIQSIDNLRVVGANGIHFVQFSPDQFDVPLAGPVKNTRRHDPFIFRER